MDGDDELAAGRVPSPSSAMKYSEAPDQSAT